jgi:hypothetical protein
MKASYRLFAASLQTGGDEQFKGLSTEAARHKIPNIKSAI